MVYAFGALWYYINVVEYGLRFWSIMNVTPVYSTNRIKMPSWILLRPWRWKPSFALKSKSFFYIFLFAIFEDLVPDPRTRGDQNWDQFWINKNDVLFLLLGLSLYWNGSEKVKAKFRPILNENTPFFQLLGLSFYWNWSEKGHQKLRPILYDKRHILSVMGSQCTWNESENVCPKINVVILRLTVNVYSIILVKCIFNTSLMNAWLLLYIGKAQSNTINHSN